MKTRILRCAAFGAALACAGVTHGQTGHKIESVGIAEQTTEGKAQPAASLEHPVSFLAIDGGYIEAGSPIGGLTPPAPRAVAQALHDGLIGAGFQPASAVSSPSVVLVYFWGNIRAQRGAIRPIDHLEPNLRARLGLGARSQVVDDIERDVVGRRFTPLEHTGRLFARPDWEDAFDLARSPRNFVIVSAYNYSDLTQGKRTLLWRTRLSTQDTSGGMDECIEALAVAGANYFGRDFPRPKFDRIPLVAMAADANGPTLDSPAEYRRRIDWNILRPLLTDDYFAFSGDIYDYKTRYPKTQDNIPASRPASGPAKAARMSSRSELASASTSGRTLEVMVCAGSTLAAGADVVPRAGQTVSYQLYDATTPADASTRPTPLHEVLRDALARQGYVVAAPGLTPELLVVLNWGTFPPAASRMPYPPKGSCSVQLSAYRLDALRHDKLALVWRTRADAMMSAVSSTEGLATVAENAAAAAGENFQPQKTYTAAVVSIRVEGQPPSPENSSVVPAEVSEPLFRGLVAGEQNRFTIRRSPIPDELAKRIVLYGRERAALESELAARTAKSAPGDATRAEIDRFNRDNSERIAALTKTREELRGEIARLSIEWAPASVDQPLDALVARFAADLQERQSEYALRP